MGLVDFIVLFSFPKHKLYSSRIWTVERDYSFEKGRWHIQWKNNHFVLLQTFDNRNKTTFFGSRFFRRLRKDVRESVPSYLGLPRHSRPKMRQTCRFGSPLLEKYVLRKTKTPGERREFGGRLNMCY